MALVTERSRLLNGLSAGAMLALPLAADGLDRYLGPDLSLAAINGPTQCVVAGSVDAVQALQARLAADGVDSRLLHISAAGHSHMVEPVLESFEKRVAAVRLKPPSLPWISDVTGRPVSPEEAVDPAYWTAHLRHTVNFSAVLETVLTAGDAALVEVGPGRTLGSLARQHPAYREDRPVVASMPHPSDETPGPSVLLTAAGQLWQAGVPIDWAALHGGERRRRVPLPSYPFQRRRFRIDEAPEPSAPDTAAFGGEATADAGVRWRSDTEAAVAAAFHAILGLRPTDGHRSFFELGGDSLLAARMTAVLRRELGVPVGVRAVFRAPTVVGLAALVDEQRAGGS
jgi:acyl transferase domain-containing protein